VVLDGWRGLDMSTTRGQHLIGQEIGSCILENLLGYGGSSAVFLAQHLSTNEKVAVKVFLPRTTMDKQGQKNFYQRFLREAEAASELDHPNILSIYSYGEHNGLPYIVMPYMPGGTLSEYVAKYGPLSLTIAQEYLAQVSSALDYAHANGCIHCDVKPANLLLDGWGKVMLSDFGIVRLMQPDGAGAEQQMKSSETLMGTPDYISPEQALGEPLDGRSDVYSLAVTLFFLLVGSPPFKAETSIAMALMHIHETPPMLKAIRVDITPQIDRVMAKALAKWPEDRYQTAGEFSAAFTEAVAEANSYAFSDNEAKRKAIGPGAWVKQVIEASRPMFRFKFIWKNSSKSRRVVLSLVLLLALILGSITSVSIFNSLTNRHSQLQPPPASTQSDLLADHQSDWPHSSAFFFKNRQYHIKNQPLQNITIAFYGTGSYQFSNFRLTVTVSEIQQGKPIGADYYGIIFRATNDLNHYYLFEFTASGGSQYVFSRLDGQAKAKWNILTHGPLPSLLPDIGQTNTITIVAKGNTFNFIVNNISVGKQVIDNSGDTLTSGQIALIVEGENTEVAFSQLHIDKL
jgi:eukaryotic-like serine/threonine-protein kinase